MFTRWGGFVYRRRRWLVLLAIVMAGGFGSLAGSVADNLSTGGWLDPTSESAQVSDRLEADYGGGRSAFIALFQTTEANADATSDGVPGRRSPTTLAPVLDIEGVTGVTGYAETRRRPVHQPGGRQGLRAHRPRHRRGRLASTSSIPFGPRSRRRRRPATRWT